MTFASDPLGWPVIPGFVLSVQLQPDGRIFLGYMESRKPELPPFGCDDADEPVVVQGAD